MSLNFTANWRKEITNIRPIKTFMSLILNCAISIKRGLLTDYFTRPSFKSLNLGITGNLSLTHILRAKLRGSTRRERDFKPWPGSYQGTTQELFGCSSVILRNFLTRLTTRFCLIFWLEELGTRESWNFWRRSFIVLKQCQVRAYRLAT